MYYSRKKDMCFALEKTIRFGEVILGQIFLINLCFAYGSTKFDV